MAHRDEFMICPSCGAGMEARGTRVVCAKCGGGLITSAELESMLNELSLDDERPLEQRLLPGTATRRGCPKCKTEMTPFTMYEVTIDRCAEHGVWFDGEELARVLNANGQAYAERNHEGQAPGSLGGLFGSTLRALFGPLIKKRKLARHIEQTSPTKPDES
jgi:Zn-finger nucleic acid-binding protein